MSYSPIYDNMQFQNPQWPRVVPCVNCWEHNWFSPITRPKVKFGRKSNKRRKKYSKRRKTRRRKKISRRYSRKK